MNKMAIIACFVLAACGNPAATTGGPSAEQPQEQPIADVLQIICDSDGTRVETPRVRAFPDGVHARFANPADAAEYWIRAARSPDDGNHGGKVPKGGERRRWSDGPGEHLIVCYQKGETPPYRELDDRYARYEVVDVDGLWIPWNTDCETPETITGQRLPQANSIEDVEAWLRDRFDNAMGVRVRPGYPETQWKGNPWVIHHEDRTLVNFHAMKDDGTWTLHRAEGCRA